MGYFLQHCIQHAVCTFDTSNIPWILQNLFFPHFSFGWEKFINISNDWPESWAKAYLHIDLSDLVIPLIFANSCP